jgi:hypothetical protein
MELSGFRPPPDPGPDLDAQETTESESRFASLFLGPLGSPKCRVRFGRFDDMQLGERLATLFMK